MSTQDWWATLLCGRCLLFAHRLYFWMSTLPPNLPAFSLPPFASCPPRQVPARYFKLRPVHLTPDRGFLLRATSSHSAAPSHPNGAISFNRTLLAKTNRRRK
eukprot:13844020-Alexandrium_andersonii.AAC.1